jgi:hypothetical protein
MFVLYTTAYCTMVVAYFQKLNLKKKGFTDVKFTGHISVCVVYRLFPLE